MSYQEVTIGGVKLKFPNKPYPCQISMMDKIIRGLQKRENCLLESPTGSGKTLSLLCSTIAWQKLEKQTIIKLANEHYSTIEQKIRESCYCECRSKKVPNLKKLKHKKIEYEEEDSVLSDDEENVYMSFNTENLAIDDCACMCHGMYNDEVTVYKGSRVPTIFFCTRTHKQIANVISEFKKTPYVNDTRMTILSSRAHTCIHPKVSKMANKDEGCKKLIKKSNEANNEASNDSTIDSGPNPQGGCSFNSRLKQKPLLYDNYGFKQSVWDIEELISVLKRKRMCPYFAARDLKDHVDIVFCPYNYLIDPKIRASMSIDLENQIIIIDEAHNIEDSSRDAASVLITKFQLEQAIVDLNKTINPNGFLHPSEENINVCRYFISVFQKLIDWIELNSLNMSQYNFDDSISKIWNGMEMVAQFKLLGLGPDQFSFFQGNVNKLRSEDSEEQFASDSVKLVADRIALIMEFLFMESHNYMDDYKVVIIKSKYESFSNDNNEEEHVVTQFSQFNKSQFKPPEFNYTINFWCLNPAVAFYYLRKCHSIILCSGTLSPMESFQSELGIEFEHRLEANHVITDKQVWVGCVGAGPNNVKLLATFKECETYGFQDEVGRLILDVCKTIPFGVLCFFPSYSLLNKLLNRWNENGITKKIKEIKSLFSETKISKGFDQLLGDYYTCIDNNTNGKTTEGALLLAVYRGRCSEGLDFSNNYARAVIAFGIPFPNVRDVQVDLKRKYNNSLCIKKKLLNGDDWYEIQAYRALNQALGRCIRHRNDWGAIILVDDRYFRQPQKYSKGLSKWIRQRFRTYKNYTDAYNSLQEFSTEMKNFKGSFHPPSTQSLQSEPSQIITKTDSQIVSPVKIMSNKDGNKQLSLKNVTQSDIQSFITSNPDEIPKIKEEFLTNFQNSNNFKSETPLQKDNYSIFSSSSTAKKRSREQKNNYSTPKLSSKKNSSNQDAINKESVSVLSLKPFENSKVNKNSYTKKEANLVNNCNDKLIDTSDIIEILDTDDDEYEFKKMKHMKRNNSIIIETSKSIERLDLSNENDNQYNPDVVKDNSIEELDLNISQNMDVVKKKPKSNLRKLLDS